MPNKEINRAAGGEPKVAANTNQQLSSGGKPAGTTVKTAAIKTVSKEAAMSPSSLLPSAAPTSTLDDERTELLGSLTTQQQQRTSARVIKKLRLEPMADRDKKPVQLVPDVPECDPASKTDEIQSNVPIKQRMPKALWSTDEKNLFFEALNEYGKDFDAVTAYICAKMKKKGMPDVNLKTKTQVSHFYYRTWQKLSKYVQFDENVKKVAQELYALINYGELRKKLVSVNEKTCARLSEMVLGGSIMVRARGRNVRVRTPMCRALRKLNQISERACVMGVWSRAQVTFRARDSAAWARVQAAAHNPRAAASLRMRVRLAALLRALHKRWHCKSLKTKNSGNHLFWKEYCKEDKDQNRDDLEGHLCLKPERMFLNEQSLPKKPVLHMGPRPDAVIHVPVVAPSEQLSSQKICFSSYLERVCSLHVDKPKVRTPKRQRKDSGTEKDKESESKKTKVDDLKDAPSESETKLLVDIDETAVDGIELMASYKNVQEDEEKPSTEDEVKAEETADEGERDKDMSEKEKDSFSEMEDDEKFNKSDTDNESDHGKSEKCDKDTKFPNLKVKFRIRSKKRGTSIYTLVNPDADEKIEEVPKDDEPHKEEDTKHDFDVETAIRQIRRGWSVYDAGDLTIGDLYLMFGSRSKLELDYWWAEPTPPLPQSPLRSNKPVPMDAERERCVDKKDGFGVGDEDQEKRESDADMMSPKNIFSHDSNDGLSGDERKGELLNSPEHKGPGCGSLRLVSKLINRPLPPHTQTSQTDGFALLSDRLKSLLALVGNPAVIGKASVGCGATGSPGAVSLEGAGGALPRDIAGARCECGHVCAHQKGHTVRERYQMMSDHIPRISQTRPMFRQPTPIAPKPEPACERMMTLDGLPRWRRGRPRTCDQRVVVQRLLPLLPKLPPPRNLIPVKVPPKTPLLPRILPKSSPVSSPSHVYACMVTDSTDDYFPQDIKPALARVELPPQSGYNDQQLSGEESVKVEQDCLVKKEVSSSGSLPTADDATTVAVVANNATTNDPPITSDDPSNLVNYFHPSESMSLSPSRLLRDSDGWLEGASHDFSLSSFLGHLEGRPPPELAVESQLQSLITESSVDYVAKFADLAAEVAGEPAP